MATVTAGKLTLADPTGEEVGAVPFHLSARPEHLVGKVLGLLDNSKANSDNVLKEIAAILDREFGFKEVVIHRKHSASVPPKPEIIEDLVQRCDIVITGVGD